MSDIISCASQIVELQEDAVGRQYYKTIAIHYAEVCQHQPLNLQHCSAGAYLKLSYARCRPSIAGPQLPTGPEIFHLRTCAARRHRHVHQGECDFDSVSRGDIKSYRITSQAGMFAEAHELCTKHMKADEVADLYIRQVRLTMQRVTRDDLALHSG